MLFNKKHTSYRGQAGDTIVEVLICIAILGAVLGTAYVVANNNTKINISSQERLAAIKLAQSQIEYLRASDATIGALGTNFCFNTNGLRINNSPQSVDCTVDAAGNVTTQEPKYNINISNTTTYASPPGAEYSIIVTWDDMLGHQSNVTYGYKVYRNL